MDLFNPVMVRNASGTLPILYHHDASSILNVTETMLSLSNHSKHLGGRSLELVLTLTTSSAVADVGDGFRADFADADDISVLRWLQYLLVPAIVALGVAANFLALVVYVFSRLRRLSCSIYLAALAVTDSGFLLCLLSRWIKGIWMTEWNYYLCPVNYYLTGVFSFLSMAYVLCYTIERYLATCWPLQRKTWCTKRRATGTVLFCLVFSLVTFLPALFMFEVRQVDNGLQCTAKQNFDTVLKWSSVCTMCVFWIIPTFLTIVINTRIIHAMVRHDDSFRNSGQQDRYSTSSLGSTSNLPDVYISRLHSGTGSKSSHRRSHYKITRMLVVSSSAFIVMGLPYEILKVYHYFKFDNWSLDDIIDHDYPIGYKVVVVLVYHLYYLNFGVDFFIYNVAGKNFRDALREVIHTFGEKIVKTLKCKHQQLPTPVKV